MRIIAGSARGLRLRVPRGLRVRPTSGRVRTSLFSILGERVEEARVADLFAGCGSLGIEALSRGAAFCSFVENARPAIAALRDNLARAHLADRAELLPHDAFTVGPNSGEATVLAPQTGAAGSIVAGALEQSNVDISREFINLISAQTGISSASRVVRVADDLLQELLLLAR